MSRAPGLSLKILPFGTVERECAARGERILQLKDLDQLIIELRRGGAAGNRAQGGEQLGLEEAPESPPAPARRTSTKGRKR